MNARIQSLILLFVVLCYSYAMAQDDDSFLTYTYDQLHDSEGQQWFKELAPWPIGVVYLQQPGEGEQEMREHFRTMRKLGITALKQLLTIPGTTFEEAALIALDEGIIPWWYGQGGWEPITDDLLKELSISKKLSMAEIRNRPEMIRYQTEVLKERVRKMSVAPEPIAAHRVNTGGVGAELPEETMPLFFNWVEKQYGTIEELNEAYNMQHLGIAPDGRPFESWADFRERFSTIISKEYRHLRDIFRFKADMRLEFVKKRIEQNNAFDPHQPYRSGGEMGMFLPFAWRGVDMEGIAELMTPHGSFYPSIHLAWHYDEVEHEVARTHYTQAALTHDYFKGGWSASWESTGGPQQFSGGKGGNGFTVDDGIMTQLMYNYMAAGYKGFGLWCWSARTAGWEAGEYALLDRHNQLTRRAEKVGLIGQACQKYRDELWSAHKEPMVGIYTDWDNEAIWAAMSVRGRDVFRQWPIDARMGASRALINANVPFEYVTASDLRKGLANRYKVIYMPFIVAVGEDMMEILSNYVEEGGRLVFDGPSFWFDDYGKMFKTNKGTVFEKTFGATINDYQYAGINVPWSIENRELKGFTLNVSTSTAKTVKAYNNGLPAITENHFGEGTAVILGCEASMMCFKPGNDDMEQFLVDQLLGVYHSPYVCNDAIVYRLAAEDADHYFIINDDEAKSVRLNFRDFKYSSMIDPLTEKTMDMNAPIEVERYNGRWIRMVK